MSNVFDEVYQKSINERERFWKQLAKNVHWHKTPHTILDSSGSPFDKWFPDGEINACYNAVDFHVLNGRAAQNAIIYDSPVTNSKQYLTYSTLLKRVSLFAGVLRSKGVEKGDRVIIYMPMIPEAVIAMLACARIGAIHSVVFGGFAANELAVRIDDATPKVILAASCGIEVNRVIEYKPLLDEAIEIAEHKPQACILYQRPQALADLKENRDSDWSDEEDAAIPCECVAVKSTDPLYILYTSGTTGQPKGVVRDTGGSVVSLKWTMQSIYDTAPGEVYWAASDVGWVVGHSYIVYGPLFNGNTSLIYEGKPVGTPDPGAFWRVISEHKVRTLFTAPTAFRAIKKDDPDGEFIKQYDISCLRSLFLAGERCDPDTLAWAEQKLQIPVIDHWWQTETGWSIAANCKGIELLPVVPGSPTRPAPGYNVQVLDEDGFAVKQNDIGALVVELPLPPGTFTTLWKAPERFITSYFSRFPGYYETGDAGYIDENGYIFVMSRTDDIINVAGHRLSTGAMEEVLASHPDVAECAVMGVKDSLKGQIPVGMLVLNANSEQAHAEIVREVIQLVRNKIGPVAAFKNAIVVKRLPKTRSGKILRATMRAIADGTEWKLPATIDDPVVLDEITHALLNAGFTVAK